jgi:hypothetical protein
MIYGNIFSGIISINIIKQVDMEKVNTWTQYRDFPNRLLESSR